MGDLCAAFYHGGHVGSVETARRGVSFLRPPPQGNPAPRCNTVSSPIQVLVHGRLGRNESTGLWWIPAFVYLRIKKKKKSQTQSSEAYLYSFYFIESHFANSL